MTSYTVDRIRWATLNIIEQMGNIGSEVGRAIAAKQQKRSRDCQQAVIRALDLFGATVEPLIALHSARAKEVLRSKEQFLEAIYGDVSQQYIQAVNQYFFQYAVAARLAR
ncbi:MAG: hypothetical protein AAB647_01230 [Patescibacteria group bacterium]